MSFLDPDQGTILRTWDTMGLRGTGSHDYESVDVFAPDKRTMKIGSRPHARGPNWRIPDSGIASWLQNGGQALGAAQGAIDEVVRHAKLVASKSDSRSLAEREHFRVALGRAQARVGSARSYVREIGGNSDWQGEQELRMASMSDDFGLFSFTFGVYEGRLLMLRLPLNKVIPAARNTVIPAAGNTAIPAARNTVIPAKAGIYILLTAALLLTLTLACGSEPPPTATPSPTVTPVPAPPTATQPPMEGHQPTPPLATAPASSAPTAPTQPEGSAYTPSRDGEELNVILATTVLHEGPQRVAFLLTTATGLVQGHGSLHHPPCTFPTIPPETPSLPGSTSGPTAHAGPFATELEFDRPGPMAPGHLGGRPRRHRLGRA